MTRFIRHCWVFATASALFATPALARDEKAWDHASSYTRDALIVVALGLPALREDWTGTLQAGESVGAAFLIKTGLKEIFPERRPDGSGNKSFPSGHSAMAFAAAASIQNREGWEAGLAAQLAATFVGGVAGAGAQASLVRRRRRRRDRRGQRLPADVEARRQWPGAALGRHRRGWAGGRSTVLGRGLIL
jgi:hypothetical protein